MWHEQYTDICNNLKVFTPDFRKEKLSIVNLDIDPVFLCVFIFYLI